MYQFLTADPVVSVRLFSFYFRLTLSLVTLNFTQVYYWDIARLEVIIDNSSVKWDGEFIELGFDDQTRLHCYHNFDHKLSKGNLECF